LTDCLVKGVSPETEGLMRMAILGGSAKVVEIILDHGANPNKLTSTDGYTYLHDAVSENQIDMVKVLLAKGANPNLKTTKGRTPLYYARKGKRRLAAITALLAPVTFEPPARITYRVDDFLAMEDPSEAYYALNAAIKKDANFFPAELRVYSLGEFFALCINTGFDNLYWQAVWAVVPCAELMEAIDEPVLAELFQKCIAIVREYGQRVGRVAFDREDDYLELDEAVEKQLQAPELDFADHYDADIYERLTRKTMEYVRKNRESFIDQNPALPPPFIRS